MNGSTEVPARTAEITCFALYIYDYVFIERFQFIDLNVIYTCIFQSQYL